MEKESVPILLVEDNPADIAIIQRTLKSGNIQNPIHLARDGQEALDFLNRRPSSFLIIILDVHLPKINGMEVLNRTMKINPEAVVIILTGHPSLQTAIRSLRRGGAFDYIQKSKDDLSGLTEAVKLAIEKATIRLQNNWVVEDKGLNRIVNMIKVQDVFGLSNREVDLVKCLCRGHSNKEIANQLFISELTVKGHLKKIFQKMKIHNRAALVSRILENTLLHS